MTSTIAVLYGSHRSDREGVRASRFVVVTGEYNHAPPPGLKNMLDHFLEEWFWRPSAVVSYSAGAFGGVRAAMQLRIVLGELGMPSISSMLPIPKVQETLSEEGEDRSGRLDDAFDRFHREFQWYIDALAAQREKGALF